MRQDHFTRPAVTAAVALLDARMSQAKFDHLVLRLGLEQHIPADTTLSVSKKTALVVAGEGAGSKRAKAVQIGIRLATPEEFAALVAELLD